MGICSRRSLANSAVGVRGMLSVYNYITKQRAAPLGTSNAVTQSCDGCSSRATFHDILQYDTMEAHPTVRRHLSCWV